MINFETLTNFYVLLNVHLSIIIDNDQHDAHLIFFILRYIYYISVHVSSTMCLSSGG